MSQHDEPTPFDDDVEGNRFRGAAEGTPDETEGHIFKHGLIDDDTEGHARRMPATPDEGDDTQGHRRSF